MDRLKDDPNEKSPWWEITLMKSSWWEITLMRDHPDERPPWWETSLVRARPCERPAWWETTLVRNHSERPPLLKTSLVRDRPDERPHWWEIPTLLRPFLKIIVEDISGTPSQISSRCLGGEWGFLNPFPLKCPYKQTSHQGPLLFCKHFYSVFLGFDFCGTFSHDNHFHLIFFFSGFDFCGSVLVMIMVAMTSICVALNRLMIGNGIHWPVNT